MGEKAIQITHHYTAFFSGCLIATSTVRPSLLAKEGWILEESTPFETEKIRHTYYDEFLNFCISKSANEGCVAWKYEVKSNEHFEDQQGDNCSYNIPAIHCYLMPFNIVIFSIELTMESSGLNQIKAVAGHIRELQLSSTVEGILLKLNEILTGSKIAKIRDALAFGYRLKFFQIIDTDTDCESQNERKLALYQLGTLESSSLERKTGFCDKYVESAVEDHSISVFNNWDALALLDSFTIRSFQSECFQNDIWYHQFYRMIYIHSLFQKFYLHSLNQRFRAMIDRRIEYKIEDLFEEFERYERVCHFHKIAYTFLPLMIDKALDSSLEIQEERSLLSQYIKDIEKRHQAGNERLVNKLLGVISCLALFSAIWDISCLVNNIFPYNSVVFGSTRRGFASVSLLLFLLVVIIFIFLVRKNRRRMFLH